MIIHIRNFPIPFMTLFPHPSPKIEIKFKTIENINLALDYESQKETSNPFLVYVIFFIYYPIVGVNACPILIIFNF